MQKTKFTCIYKSDNATHTWHYDLNRFRNGPVCVEIQYHDGLIEWSPDKKKKAKTKTTRKSKLKTANKKTAEWFNL